MANWPIVRSPSIEWNSVLELEVPGKPAIKDEFAESCQGLPVFFPGLFLLIRGRQVKFDFGRPHVRQKFHLDLFPARWRCGLIQFECTYSHQTDISIQPNRTASGFQSEGTFWGTTDNPGSVFGQGAAVKIAGDLGCDWPFDALCDGAVREEARRPHNKKASLVSSGDCFAVRYRFMRANRLSGYLSHTSGRLDGQR